MSRSNKKDVIVKKKKKDAIPLDEYDNMDYDILSENLKKDTSSVNEIKRSRNYYQLERDSVQTYYDIVKDEVEKTDSHIRNIEAQMERMQDTHRNDIRIYLQKVIHLEYEHNNNIEAVNTLSLQDSNNQQINHTKNKNQLKNLKLHLKSELKKDELSNEEEIKRLKEVERKEMTKLRETFERNHNELINNYETKLQALRDDLELRRKMEIHEIEERKNRHINDLIQNHNKNFKEMRNYYNSITQDNLDLIKELNNEIEDLKVAHQQNEKAMEQIEKKNASLSEPLYQAEMRVKSLQHKLLNYNKDKISLKHAKARLVVLEEEYKLMIDKHNKLKDYYNKIHNERDRLYSSFEDTIMNVQKKSNIKNVQLEKMLDEYKDLFEIKKAQFTSVLRASNLDPLVLQNVTKKLDDVLSAKNEQIHELNYETAKVMKAHNDLVRVYEAKLLKFGIPKNQLHLEAILVPSNGQETGTQPADLIVQ